MPASQERIPRAFSSIAPICLIMLALLTVAGCNTSGTDQPTPSAVPVYTPTSPLVAPTDTMEAAAPTAAPTDTLEPASTPTEEAVGSPLSQADQWSQVSLAGKEVQNFSIFVTNTSVILATGPAGAWRGASEPKGNSDALSFDDYHTWESLPVKLSGRVTSGAIGGSNVMYVTSHTGCQSGLPIMLLRSTDGGKGWQAIPGALAPLMVKAVDDKTAYGITCRGVVRTTDSGSTWTILPGAALENYDPNAIAVGPTGKSLYVAYTSEGGSSRITRSTDRGGTWTEITPKVEPGSQLEAASHLTFVSGQTANSAIYMTSDQGLWYLPTGSSEWKLIKRSNSKLENPERITAVYAETAPESPPGAERDTVYIATAVLEGGNLRGTGVLRSTDNGASWEQFGKGLDQRVVNDIMFAPYMHKHPPEAPGWLLAGTNDGIWAESYGFP